jgi:hypothetical protein
LVRKKLYLISRIDSIRQLAGNKEEYARYDLNTAKENA